jgi:hypothetical protein
MDSNIVLIVRRFLWGIDLIMTEHSSGIVGSWVGLFVLDAAIFGLTVYNGYQTRRRMTPAPNLHSIVVRDGVHDISAVCPLNP